MIVHETHAIHDTLAPFFFMSFHLCPLPNNLHRPGNWHDDLELLSFRDGTAIREKIPIKGGLQRIGRIIIKTFHIKRQKFLILLRIRMSVIV